MAPVSFERSESSIEQASKRYAEGLGCTLLKVQSVKGWPDRLLLVPNGIKIFIEFKRPTKEPRLLQSYILGRLEHEGHRAVWIDNLEDFKKLVTLARSLPRNGNPMSIKYEEFRGFYVD